MTAIFKNKKQAQSACFWRRDVRRKELSDGIAKRSVAPDVTAFGYKCFAWRLALPLFLKTKSKHFVLAFGRGDARRKELRDGIARA